jgi:hypothetical protein
MKKCVLKVLNIMIIPGQCKVLVIAWVNTSGCCPATPPREMRLTGVCLGQLDPELQEINRNGDTHFGLDRSAVIGTAYLIALTAKTTFACAKCLYKYP